MPRYKTNTFSPGRWLIVTLLALPLLVLTLVSIAAHHAEDFGLDKKPVRNKAILAIFGAKLPSLEGVQVEGKWLLWQSNNLYLGGEQLVECNGAFVGAITLPNYWVAACERDLLVFTYEQELLERVGKAVGVSYPLAQIGACEALLCYQVGKKIFQMNIETLEITPFTRAEGHALQWSAPDKPPQTEIAKVFRQNASSKLTWGQVVRNIHNGKIFGKVGPWLMDTFALLFLVLAVVGLFRWSRP